MGLAVLPFYVDNAISVFGGDPNGANAQMTGMFRVLRAFRLGRVFRVFRHSKNFAQMRVMTDTFASSSQALYVLAFLCIMSAVIFSSALYFMEKLQCDPALERFRTRIGRLTMPLARRKGVVGIRMEGYAAPVARSQRRTTSLRFLRHSGGQRLR